MDNLQPLAFIPLIGEAKMPRIDCSGRTVSYTDSGDGPPVVLLPPGASPASAWRRVIEALGSNHRSIAINPAGYGDTDPVGSNAALTVDDEAAAVLAIVSGFAGKVHLVGHSYGGVIALQLALTTPERFATLTLFEPAPYAILADAGETDLAADVERLNYAFIADVEAGRTEQALATYIDHYNGRPGTWADLGEKARAKLLAVADNVSAGLTASHGNRYRLTDYAGISIPTRVAAGSVTDPVHARLSELIAGAIVGADLEHVPGAGHMLSLTHPEESAAIILKHIADR